MKRKPIKLTPDQEKAAVEGATFAHAHESAKTQAQKDFAAGYDAMIARRLAEEEKQEARNN